jgi:hypothetical protein
MVVGRVHIQTYTYPQSGSMEFYLVAKYLNIVQKISTIITAVKTPQKTAYFHHA